MQMIHRFSLKVTQSTGHLVEILNTFSIFSGLKANLIKCEIGIGALISVQFTVCGMKCINLRHFRYLLHIQQDDKRKI